MKLSPMPRGAGLSAGHTILATILFLLFSHTSSAATREDRRPAHRVPKIDDRIEINARLDEPVWTRALRLELDYEVKPGENIDPPVRTEVLLAYDESHLYVAFRAYDPDPSQIRARIRDREDLGGDDWVGLVFDTFNGERRSFDFIVNPFGVQSDFLECPDCGGDSYDAIWNSAGRITDWGYVVEISIPFSSMRFQRTVEDQIWGFDAVRSYPRSVRHHIGLFPRDRNDNCYLCQTEKLIGFAGASPGRNIEIAPTFSALYSQEREGYTSGDFIEKDESYDPGLTARWGITPNMNLQGTINPDFSQIEADAVQLDINTNFAIYYPEKRPFFMEGADLFSTMMNVVYSRTLADPDWGLKLTGKEGKNAIGFYSARDGVTNLLFPGSQGSGGTTLGMRTMGTVLRYRRDIFKSSTLGVLATDREGDGYYNRLAGIDGQIKLSKRDRIQFQINGTETEYPDSVAADFDQPEGAFRGLGLLGLYIHETEQWGLFGFYYEKCKNFRADMGFEPKVDIRHYEAGIEKFWNRESGRWFTRALLGTSWELEEERSGARVIDLWNVYAELEGPYQYDWSFRAHTWADFYYLGEKYSYKHYHMNSSFVPTGGVTLYFNHTLGDIVDYDNARQAKILKLEPGFQLDLGRRLSIGYDHSWERLSVMGGRELYTANVGRLRMKYQFDRRMFLRANVQYVSVDRDEALYYSPQNRQTQTLLSQVLFSYTINPQTVLYMGYSDNYIGLKDDHPEAMAIDLTQTDRTFFMKIGYAWVL